MVRKYFVQQLGLLLMVSVIIILTNVIGYKMPVKDSIIGVLLLSAISLIGLTISKFMSRPSYIILSSPYTCAQFRIVLVHFFVASKVARYWNLELTNHSPILILSVLLRSV